MTRHADTSRVAQTDLVIHLTTTELDHRIEAAVARVLEAQPPAPALLTRVGLAQALDCSTATIARLRAQGCPCDVVGDSPRFDLAEVRKWLKERAAGKADTP